MFICNVVFAGTGELRYYWLQSSLDRPLHAGGEGRGPGMCAAGMFRWEGEEWEGVGTWCVLLGCLGEEERRQIKKDSLHVHV